jgi:anaerobic magnesium-protoporphyrin IX monomethyl ester cyclase
MGYFKNICLIKAPQTYELPFSINVPDLTELCYLAAMVEKNVDSISMPENYMNQRIYDSFSALLKKNRIDLVGISSLTGAYNNALRLAKIAKENGKYVVMGGYHPSALPEEVLKSAYVDAVIIGEGEETFREFVNRGPGKDVAGLAYKDNGGIVFTPPRPLIADLDTIPHPLRRIRPPRFGEKSEDYSADTVFTSRGCPWHCSFCANDTVQKRWRARSPENVVEEISRLHDPKKRKGLKIWDANFLVNIPRVEKICDLMIERDLTNFWIWTEARVTDVILAEGILDKLYKVGLRSVHLGIESPNENTLKLMRKKKTPNDDAKAAEILKRHKIAPWGYFIIGHINENVEETKRYPEYAAALNLRWVVFMIMTPYPGTAVFKEYQAEDKIKSFDWDLYNNFCPVVETRGMNLQTLKKMYAYCHGRFFGKVHFSKFLSIGLIDSVAQLVAVYGLSWYALLRINKTYTEEEIKDLAYEEFQAAVGVKITRDYKNKKKKNWWLNAFKTITFRIVHSAGKTIDLRLTQQQHKRYLVVEESFGREVIHGPVLIIKLDKIMKLARALYPDRYISLNSNWEFLELGFGAKVWRLIKLLGNKDILITFIYLFRALLGIMTQTVFYVLTSPLRILKRHIFSCRGS